MKISAGRNRWDRGIPCSLPLWRAGALLGRAATSDDQGCEARIVHDGSSRNRAVASRDGRAEPRGTEAYLKEYVERLSGEPARLHAAVAACRLVVAANGRLQQKRS